MTVDKGLGKPAGIARIVYKEIVGGDRRKFEATSNDSQTGGGARDLRFSPYEKFSRVFEKMFPSMDDKGISAGSFHWLVNGKETVGRAYFHPPTNARPNEGRIANVDKYLPTNSLPSEKDGTTILIILQRDDGTVWPHFTTDRSLDADAWHDKVRDTILACLRAQRRAGTSTCGFIDFVTKEVFCNGR